jgi:hypothetical protein
MATSPAATELSRQSFLAQYLLCTKSEYQSIPRRGDATIGLRLLQSDEDFRMCEWPIH